VFLCPQEPGRIAKDLAIISGAVSGLVQALEKLIEFIEFLSR